MNNKYLQYKGKYYDVGTEVLIKTRWFGVQKATFFGWSDYPFRGKYVSEKYYSFDTEKYIVEITKPIVVTLAPIKINNKKCPLSWKVEIGWIWYILTMAVSFIFKGFWIAWVIITIIFILWKNGILKEDK